MTSSAPVSALTASPQPTYADILAARPVVAAKLPATPQWSAPALDAATGCRVVLKHEHTQPTGAFKVRGGIVLLAGLPAGQRERGVVTYSTGNHGQSLAYAALLHGVPCRIVLPAPANTTKLRALRALGAHLEVHGASLEEAGARARELADRDGLRLVSPGDEPELIAGVGTLYLEVLEAEPELDYLVVPVGGGSGAAAACLVAAELAPSCRVIGVQSSASRAAYDSWRAGSVVSRPNLTGIDGLATGSGYAVTQRIMVDGLHDFVLVDDDAIRAAQLMLLTHAHTMAEGAGAAGLAAVLALGATMAGSRVGVVVTGGNASPDELRAVLGDA